MTKLESQLVGVAGEYLVAGELTLRGYLASITLRNSKGIDIIASNANATKSISIQVKTNSNGSASWILNKKSETYYSNSHFYIFVSIKKIGTRPSYYIVPSKEVAKFIKTDHLNWLNGKRKNGEARQDTNMRKFRDKEDKYLEKWEILKL